MADIRETERRLKETLKRLELSSRREQSGKKGNPYKAGDEKSRLRHDLKGGKTKAEAPRSHILSGVKLRQKVVDDLIKDYLELEKAGRPSVQLDRAIAASLVSSAINGSLDSSEVFDIVSALATVYKDNPTEREEYRRLLRDMLSGIDHDERKHIVEANEKSLQEATQDGYIEESGRDTVSTIVKQEAVRINEDYLVRPEAVYSQRAKQYVEELRRENREDPTFKHDPARLEEKIKHIKTSGMPESDAKTIRETLLDRETHVEQKLQELPREYKENMQRIESDLFKKAIDMGRIKDKSKLPDAEPLSLETEALFDKFTKVIDWKDPAKTGASEAIKPEAHLDVLQSLQKELDQAINNKQITDQDQRLLEETLGLLRTREKLFTAIGRTEYDRLAEAGVRDPRKKEIFRVATNPEAFLRKLKEASSNTAFIKDFQKDVQDLATEMLAVVDSDDSHFFSQLFNTLIHEPQYANLVTGLSNLEAEIRRLEDAGDLKIMMQTTKYNYEKRGEEADHIKLSEFVGRLNTWVKDEKDWKRMTHDGYVLMLTHNFKYFAEMANSIVDMGKVSSVLLSGGNELELALSAHNAYVQGRYGMNWWKAPGEVLTRDQSGHIPVDEYVREVLRLQTTLSPKDINRLTTLARGFNPVATLETHDVYLSAGDKPGGLGAGLTEPFGILEWNPLITMERFKMDVPFQKHEFLYHKVGEKKWGIAQIAHPRIVANEISDAEQLFKERQQRGRSRIFTDAEFEGEGIAFMDMYESMLTTGGYGARGWRWRGEQAYHHLYIDSQGNHIQLKPGGEVDHKNINHDVTFKNLLSAHLQVANSVMEMWYGSGKITKEDRNRYREMVWQRLKDIAPQAFVVLEKDLLNHRAMAEWRTMGEEELLRITLDAETITRNLLNKENEQTARSWTNKTLAELGDDDSKWLEALVSNQLGKKYEQKELDAFTERAKRAKKYMLTLQSKVVDDVIKGKSYDRWEKGSYKSYKPEVWREAAHVRSFPSHYRSALREANWAATGDRTTGRLVGDNFTIAEGFKTVIQTEFKQHILNAQSHPEKAKEEKYNSLVLAIRKYADAIQAVHGTTSDDATIVNVYRTGYVLDSLIADWFGKGTVSRYVPGASLLNPASSWVHWATGQAKSEIEAQEIRILADQSVAQNIIAPYHGGAVQIKKYGPLSIPVPKIRWLDVWRFKKVIPVLDRVPWSAFRFAHEHGVTDLHVAIDMAESLVPLMLGLLALAASQMGLKDTSEK